MEDGLHSPVLVLNANYEPLNVCSVRRALGLLFEGRAHLILNGRGEIRTVSRVFPIPSVIRLDYMVKRPRPVVKLTRYEVFRRDNFTCQYCGRRVSRPTLDHVIPRQRGGTYSWENLVTACPECNLRKGNRTPEEAHMPLLREPKAPPATAWYRFQHYLKRYHEWEEFLRGW